VCPAAQGPLTRLPPPPPPGPGPPTSPSTMISSPLCVRGGSSYTPSDRGGGVMTRTCGGRCGGLRARGRMNATAEARAGRGCRGQGRLSAPPAVRRRQHPARPPPGPHLEEPGRLGLAIALPLGALPAAAAGRAAAAAARAAGRAAAAAAAAAAGRAARVAGHDVRPAGGRAAGSGGPQCAPCAARGRGGAVGGGASAGAIGRAARRALLVAPGTLLGRHAPPLRRAAPAPPPPGRPRWLRAADSMAPAGRARVRGRGGGERGAGRCGARPQPSLLRVADRLDRLCA
jgi:hypothetical protein